VTSALPAFGPAVSGARDGTAAGGGGACAAATLLDDLLCLRVLGEDAGALRDYLARAWAALRAAVIGVGPCQPRVWRT
jgi:urease accessory protein UreH